MPWTTIAVRLLVAAGLSTLIGLERELRSKPAGLRTNIVVGVATAAFSLAGAEIFGGGDPTRVASEIVSGIGFLGGGAIFAAGGRPRGITTAAAMWAAAAIGMTAGMGEFVFAALVAIVTLLVLWPIDMGLEAWVQRKARQTVLVSLVAEDVGGIVEAQDAIVARGLRVLEITLHALGDDIRADVSVHGPPDAVTGLLDQLRALPRMRFVAHDGDAV